MSAATVPPGIDLPRLEAYFAKASTSTTSPPGLIGRALTICDASEDVRPHA